MLTLILVYFWVRSIWYPTPTQRSKNEQEEKAILAMMNALRQYEVIPDALEQEPSEILSVRYACGVQMQLGNELRPQDIKDAPVELSWPIESQSTLHTLLLIDLDAPSRHQRHQLAQIVHWLVVNIPGDNIALGQTVFEYLGAGTPEGTGLHRYVQLVFKQNSPLTTCDLPNERESRVHFCVRDFAARHNLGAPVAANFFCAQFDESIRTKRAEKVALAFGIDQIVPHAIDQAPDRIAHVRFVSPAMMNLGTELAPIDVRQRPVSIRWSGVDCDALHTLIFVDLDVPSRADARFRETLHWLVVNIRGNDIESGNTYAEYIGCGPPKDTGLHRYVLLIFRQPKLEPIQLDREKIGERVLTGRYAFKTRHLIEDYQLGVPIAGNYFQAQYDDSVPQLHSQFIDL